MSIKYNNNNNNQAELGETVNSRKPSMVAAVLILMTSFPVVNRDTGSEVLTLIELPNKKFPVYSRSELINF